MDNLSQDIEQIIKPLRPMNGYDKLTAEATSALTQLFNKRLEAELEAVKDRGGALGTNYLQELKSRIAQLKEAQQ